MAKVTVSLDPAVAERARQDVAEAEAEDLDMVLAELFDETGGQPSDQELALARQRLAPAEQRLA